MSVWFKQSLDDAMLASESLARIEALFVSVFGGSNYPEDAAVFIRHESERRLHCEVVVYFSPAAADVANAVDAEPCDIPLPDGLGVLAGSKACRLILFPEHDG